MKRKAADLMRSPAPQEEGRVRSPEECAMPVKPPHRANPASPSWLDDPHLALGGHDEASVPILDIFGLEYFRDSFDQILSIRGTQPNQ
jgi:hypothetical protein